MIYEFFDEFDSLTVPEQLERATEHADAIYRALVPLSALVERLSCADLSLDEKCQLCEHLEPILDECQTLERFFNVATFGGTYKKTVDGGE